MKNTTNGSPAQISTKNNQAKASPTPPDSLTSTSPRPRTLATSSTSTSTTTSTTSTSTSTTTVPSISTKTYRSLKAKLKHQESTNYDSIFMIPCSGNSGWYEIAEHSALIYYYEVCQKLQLKPNFFADDNSFYDQYEIGFIRTKNVDDIRSNLKKSGLYSKEQKSGATYIFKLNTKFTEQYLKELLSRESNRRVNNLTPGKTDNLDPALHQTLASLSTRLHHLCNSHLDKLSSQTNGTRIVTLIDKLLLSYHQLTYFPKSESGKIKLTLETMRRDIYRLTIEVQILASIKLWDFDICASLVTLLEKSRDYIESDLKRLLKNGEL